MISQFSFLLFLHCAGVVFALPLRRTIPLPFISLSGILWGGLFFVLNSTALLVMGLPYHLTSLALIFGVWVVVFLGFILVRGRLPLARGDVRILLTWSVIPLTVFLLTSVWNATVVSPDSLYMILNGRAFTTEGFSLFVREQLALRGIFVQALHAAGPLLEQDYVYALQPAFTLVSASLFVYLGWRIIIRISPAGSTLWPIWVGLLGLAGTYLVVFQTFYIHTNLLSGSYLMVGLACFWLALQEKRYQWLVFGVLSLTAFSLLRNEAPLFALLFFSLLLSHVEIPYQVRLAAVLPFCLLLIGWNLYLLAGAGNSYILSPTNILILVSALAGFGGLVIASQVIWIKEAILPRLHWILLAGGIGLSAVLVIVDAARWWAFLENLLLNMTIYGLWGTTWFMAAAGLVFIAALPGIPYQRLFTFGIPIFLIFLLAVSTQNTNYKLEWSDSANRMLTHILPSVFLFLSIKASQALHPPGMEVKRLRKSRAPLLIGLGSGLVVFTLVVWLAL